MGGRGLHESKHNNTPANILGNLDTPEGDTENNRTVLPSKPWHHYTAAPPVHTCTAKQNPTLHSQRTQESWLLHLSCSKLFFQICMIFTLSWGLFHPRTSCIWAVAYSKDSSRSNYTQDMPPLLLLLLLLSSPTFHIRDLPPSLFPRTLIYAYLNAV